MTAPPPPVDIPYAFARRHGVVLQPRDGGWQAALREGADPRVLIELRRHLAHGFTVDIVGPARFDELRRLGVEDLFIVQDAGPNQFAISLGLFKNEQAAGRHLNLLREKGVRSAQIASRGANVLRVEVRGPSDSLATLASDLSERLRGANRLECAP